MERHTSMVDFEMDNSTAPTTPDGSLTFSPALQAMRLQDALEHEALERREPTGFESLDRTLSSSPLEIKNICCIGAGYVGTLYPIDSIVYFLILKHRRTDSGSHGIPQSSPKSHGRGQRCHANQKMEFKTPPTVRAWTLRNNAYSTGWIKGCFGLCRKGGPQF